MRGEDRLGCRCGGNGDVRFGCDERGCRNEGSGGEGRARGGGDGRTRREGERRAEVSELSCDGVDRETRETVVAVRRGDGEGSADGSEDGRSTVGSVWRETKRREESVSSF